MHCYFFIKSKKVGIKAFSGHFSTKNCEKYRKEIGEIKKC
jgi:hypothetical protein